MRKWNAEMTEQEIIGFAKWNARWWDAWERDGGNADPNDPAEIERIAATIAKPALQSDHPQEA